MHFGDISKLDTETRIIILEKENAGLKRQLEERQSSDMRISNLEMAYVALRGDLQRAFELFQKDIVQVMETQVAIMEKEAAALKRQIEDRPQHIEELVQTEIGKFFKGMTFEKWDEIVNGK
jgi:hypothetical protein